MSDIGSDGIRRTGDPGALLRAQALARASELARALAAALQEATSRASAEDARSPRQSDTSAPETARVLVEATRLPAEAREGFLSATAGASPSEPRRRAEAIREQIAQAFPPGSEARRSLGAALVSVGGGEPRTLEASALEAKVEAVLAKLVAGSSELKPSTRTSSADAMERARGVGIFGGRVALPTAPPGGASYGIHELASGIATVPALAKLSEVDGSSARDLSARLTAALRALPEGWQPVVGHVQAHAPGLATGIVSLARAESAVASARGALIDKGAGVWARAQAAAGDDVMGRIAARFEGVRERLEGGFRGAATLRDSVRAESLAAMARDVRGEATAVREDIALARELLPEGVARRVASFESAEREMRASEYALQAFTTQQDLISAADVGGGSEAPPAESSEPTTFTPEMLESLRASGRVPEEILARLESGEITPELLAQLPKQGTGLITDEELARIGTGITEAPPAQGFWNVGTVGAGMEPAFSCEESCRLSNEAVNRVIGDATSVRSLEGAELAAAIRDMGVPLEKVDPNQLAAALGYINTGSSGAVAEFGRGAPQTVAEQKERLTLALRQFRCLAENGPPPMDRRLAIEVMWSAAKIPGHAFEKLSDAEVLATAQQVAAACNTPGKHEFKIGSHTVKLTIGESGSVDSTSTKAPSFWSRVGQIAKVALTVASFIPGPVGLVARGIQAGISLVNAIRNGGGFLELLSAGASFVGAGAAAVGRLARTVPTVARIAGNVARVANSVAGVARGVQGIRQGGVGGILTGAAGIAGGIAGGIQGAGAAASSPLGRFATDIGNVGRQLGRVGAAVGAAEGYINANRAVSEARENLERAQATGDPGQIRRAQERLAEAEQGKRSAVFGGLASIGQVAADTFARDSSGQDKPRTNEVGEQGRSSFQVGAEIFSRGMNAARGVNEGDVLTAGVEALGAAAAARQGTAPIRDEVAMDREGRPIPLTDANRQRIPGQFQTREDFDFLNQASSVLDGLNTWRGAERGESQAREAVGRAERGLQRAQASGDAEAIREAEAILRQARQGLVQADLGSTLALNNAAERFTGATATFQNSRAADAYRFTEAVASLRGSSARTAAELERLVREGADGGGPVAERALDDLRRAQADLDAAQESGDRDRIRTAATRLGDAEAIALAARDQASQELRGFAALRERPGQASTPPAPAAPPPEGYRVRANDNPTVIAARITAERAARGLPGISAQDILEANGLTEASARTLQVGQTLVIPDETRHPSLVITPEQLEGQRRGAVSTQGGTYRVAAGATLGDILRANPHLTEADLRALNPQISADGRVYEGQTLDIPSADRVRTNAQGQRVVLTPQALDAERDRRDAANRIASAVNQEVGFARAREAGAHEGFAGGLFSLEAAANILNPAEREARAAARDAYQRAAIGYQRISADTTATESERQAAFDALGRARLEFHQREGTVNQARSTAGLFTIVGAGAAAFEGFVTDTSQRIADRGTILAHDYLPAPLGHLVGTGLQMGAEAQRQGAGIVSGFVQNALVAPANFFTTAIPDALASGGESLRPFGQLADRLSDSTRLGRTLEIGFRAAMGGYGSLDEFSADVRQRLSPFGIAEAQWGLTRDLFAGFTAQAREDFASGHYGRGAGRILGDIFDVGTVLGAVSRGARLTSVFSHAADGLGDAARVGGGIAREGLAPVDNFARGQLRVTGARGPASGRLFDPTQTGGPIHRLTASRVRVTDRAIDVVERHVARFGPDRANQVMIDRLRRVARGELRATPADLNFYTHELRESVRYRRLGFTTGKGDDYRLWNDVHTATLEDYGLAERGPAGEWLLYHPDAWPFLE